MMHLENKNSNELKQILFDLLNLRIKLRFSFVLSEFKKIHLLKKNSKDIARVKMFMCSKSIKRSVDV